VAKQPLGVREDLDTTPRQTLFTLFGVPVQATPGAWQSVVSFVPPAVLATFVLLPSDADLLTRIAHSVLWVLMAAASIFIHSIGHIIGGKLVNAPMDSLLITKTRHVNIYNGNQDGYPWRVHLYRAMSGPAANAITGLIALGIIGIVGGSLNLWLFALPNLLLGIAAALAPVESVDGEILWKYIQHRRTAQRTQGYGTD
jgi:hypothetical protein